MGGEAGDGGSTSTDTGATSTATTVDPTNGTSATTASTSATTASTTSPTTTATVGTFGEDSTTEDPDTGGFIIDPDGGGACLATSYCDVWAQDCSRGEKCLPWDLCDVGSWSGTRCSELDPNPAGIGESCTVIGALFAGADDCDIGSMCWDPDPDTLEGECVAFCSGSEANPLCDDPATTCFLGFQWNVISLCLPRCNPLAPLCEATQACIFDHGSDGSFVCMPELHVAPQAYGDDCSDALACGTGLVCRAAADVPGCVGTHCCTTLSDLGAAPVCPDATQACLPFYDDGTAPEGLESLCFCGVPE